MFGSTCKIALSELRYTYCFYFLINFKTVVTYSTLFVMLLAAAVHAKSWLKGEEIIIANIMVYNT